MLPSRILVLLTLACLISPPSALRAATGPETFSLAQTVEELRDTAPGKSGTYIFEKGEQSLLARAWLCDRAQTSIDVQYFIWSSDNIGILAAESLLRAAERGVRIRVIVDDFLVDAAEETILALNAHPLVHIRIYNPQHTVGVSRLKRLVNMVFQFRLANQRMHDKTFTVDGLVSMTGGRNMADEYFDYDHAYNFRDRDVLLIGPVVQAVQSNFERFWQDPLVVPLEQALGVGPESIPPGEAAALYEWLHRYAADPANFKPEIRQVLQRLHHAVPTLAQELVWDDIRFIHDRPGKNSSRTLGGGGDTTRELVQALTQARRKVIIQSPYLVLPPGGLDLFRSLVKRGVEVKISTNSLAATDNLQAFSGYRKQRRDLLEAGIGLYEYKPDPAIQRHLMERYKLMGKKVPTFAIHAKSMVIDDALLFIGTFNLDPRSANLNTEVGVLINNRELAAQITAAIEADMKQENSWHVGSDNPDRHAPWLKRIQVLFWKLLPLEPLL